MNDTDSLIAQLGKMTLSWFICIFLFISFCTALIVTNVWDTEKRISQLIQTQQTTTTQPKVGN